MGTDQPVLRRILVTSDFSLAARRAVVRAALLAKQSSAELHILHVLPDRSLFDRLFRRSDVDHAAIAAGAERAMQVELAAIRARTGVEAKPLMLEGTAHRVINAAASQIRATLVVIGAHGERESAHGARTLGGTTLKAFARTSVPLLLVRREVEGNYYKVIAAIDGSADSSRALEAAVEIAESRAICQVLHVFDAPFSDRLRGHDVKEVTIAAYAAQEECKAQERLKALLAEVAGTEHVHVILVRGNPAVVLLREIRERQPDVVVVGKRRCVSDLEPQPFGSVSLQVAFEAASDVLVIP